MRRPRGNTGLTQEYQANRLQSCQRPARDERLLHIVSDASAAGCLLSRVAEPSSGAETACEPSPARGSKLL